MRVVDATNDWVGRVTAFVILILVAEVVVGVVARYGFNRPFIWAQEIACFVCATYILLGAGYALLHKQHVNVEIVYNIFPLRWRARVDLFTALLFFIFAVALVWQGADMAWNSIEVREHLATAWHGPVYPWKVFVPIGGLLLLLQGIAKFIHDLAIAKSGKEEE